MRMHQSLPRGFCTELGLLAPSCMEKLHSGPASTAKRKRRERAFRFESFCEPGYPADLRGGFLENVRELVGFGYPEARVGGGRDGGVQCCSFNLELHHYPSSYLRLYVAEETVGMSLYRQCHYCTSVGWGHHMICNKRFHFVVPCKGSTPKMEDLSVCVSSKYCRNAVRGTKTVDTRSSHLLHGVVHSNGFGHLIRINGVGGGSEFISGHRIMDLWDRICTALRMRKVSITDVAKKGSMELRLIHGLAYGQSWFGRWGYKFGHGSYGVTLQMYQASVDALRGLPLSLLVPRSAFSGRDVPMIVAKYQTASGHALSTLSDLVRFMLELDRRLPQGSPVQLDFNGIVGEATCRWSTKRVETAAQVIVEALRRSESRWVTRQDVRDAARAYIGDTGLLDYVLKSLGNHVVGDYIVRRTVNPVTKVLEYCLQDISSMFPRFERLGSIRLQVTRTQLAKDLLYLYKHVLREKGALPAAATGVFGAIPMAVRVVLDTKHHVKDYNGSPRSTLLDAGSDGQYTRPVACTVRVRSDHDEQKGLLPHETIVVAPAGTTVGSLKREVEKRFRETYLGLKNFVAESVAGVKEEAEEALGVLELGNVVVVEGRIVGNGDGEEIYEDGSAVSVIDCVCGAKEKDGERMVCCDICEVWQHVRCARIVDEEEEVVEGEEEGPRVFVCNRCDSGILALPSIHYLD